MVLISLSQWVHTGFIPCLPQGLIQSLNKYLMITYPVPGALPKQWAETWSYLFTWCLHSNDPNAHCQFPMFTGKCQAIFYKCKSDHVPPLLETLVNQVYKLILFMARQANKSRNELLGQGITTLFGKPNRPRRWWTSITKNHLPWIRIQASFLLKGEVMMCLVAANFLVPESLVLCKSSHSVPINLGQDKWYSLFCNFVCL